MAVLNNKSKPQTINKHRGKVAQHSNKIIMSRISERASDASPLLMLDNAKCIFENILEAGLSCRISSSPSAHNLDNT
jgi:hypothetical protein